MLNVDLNWLMCGEGGMFRCVMNESELNKKEQQLINHYRKMSDDVQAAFDASFKFLSRKQSNRNSL